MFLSYGGNQDYQNYFYVPEVLLLISHMILAKVSDLIGPLVTST